MVWWRCSPRRAARMRSRRPMRIPIRPCGSSCRSPRAASPTVSPACWPTSSPRRGSNPSSSRTVPGIAGTASVAKSAPDGYTLMLTSNGHTIASVVNKNLPYDPAKDFAGVTPVATVPQALIIPPDLSAKTLMEWVALARSKPGEMNFSSAGLASTSYLGCGIAQADRQAQHRPYPAAWSAGSHHQCDARRVAAFLSRRQHRGRAAQHAARYGQSPFRRRSGARAARRADGRRGRPARNINTMPGSP